VAFRDTLEDAAEEIVDPLPGGVVAYADLVHGILAQAVHFGFSINGGRKNPDTTMACNLQQLPLYLPAEPWAAARPMSPAGSDPPPTPARAQVLLKTAGYVAHRPGGSQSQNNARPKKVAILRH
jgi:hypothetical protein